MRALSCQAPECGSPAFGSFLFASNARRIASGKEPIDSEAIA